MWWAWRNGSRENDESAPLNEPRQYGAQRASGEIPDSWKKLERAYDIDIAGNPVFEQALTHRSARDTQELAPHQTYERIEFLGDSILGLVTADILFHSYPNEAEGFLTKLRSKIVKKDTLADLAVRIGLDEAMKLGERSQGLGIESSRAVLSDIFESFIGAIYLTHGFQKAFDVTSSILDTHLSIESLSHQTDNFKSMLLEYCQEKKIPNPVYRIVSEEGPGHDKTFSIEVAVDGTTLGMGEGKSKKQAEQHAAKLALKSLKVSD